MRLLSVKQVSKRLSVSPMTVYRMIRNGRLPYIKAGAEKGFRIAESDVQNVLIDEIID